MSAIAGMLDAPSHASSTHAVAAFRAVEGGPHAHTIGSANTAICSRAEVSCCIGLVGTRTLAC